MMYDFCKYPDGTEVVFSDIRKNENGDETVRVCFERPTQEGFDTIIFELPSYKIVKKDGNFTQKEIDMFTTIVERGVQDFFEWAREGGMHIA